ncbi:aminotransferase class V-fold PLP-dependent enzyme [Flavobacteriaceae bacterium R38]|nr:aminotransferase class V-fold PLP-dependent enzyme [Flavobacteriaceae bacterium R38]
MKNTDRRKFIKSFTTGIAGSLVLPNLVVANDTSISKKWPRLKEEDTEAFWEAVKEQFVFAPRLRYFNNASLGPSPVSVQKAAEEFRKTLDGFPSKYMWGGWQQKKETVRENVAELFSVSKEEIALIHNTTEGINLIARSFDLKPGDEVILADHEHPSGTIPWEVWQESRGIKLVRPELPILPKNKEEIVEIYKKAITPKTKIISMCHIVNTNGMILPVKEVSKIAHEKGILVAVDGAQSAGMFKIDLHDLECDFYAASSHKWLFSPKGVGIFYAKKESQHHLKPLMVARGHTDSSIRRLENYNTRNLSEILGLGAAIEFYDEVGQQKIHQRSYELKSYFRSKIEGNPKFKLKTPPNDELSSAIQVVEVLGKNVSDVKKQLADEFNIDCRPMTGFNLNALRFSFAIYITKKDIDELVTILEKIA